MGNENDDLKIETPASGADSAPSGDRPDANEPEVVENFDDLLSEPKDDADEPPASGAPAAQTPAAASSPQTSAPPVVQTPPQATTPPAQTQPPAAATPPTQQQAPAAQTPPAAAGQPPAAGSQTPPAGEGATTQPPAQQTQDQPVDVEALRKKTVDELASLYTFTDEEKAQLLEAPHEVLPRLAAQVNVQAYEAVCRTVFAQLPMLVTRVLEEQSSAQQREDAFFKAWPGLKDTKYRDALVQTGNLYRAQNPQATLEDVINKVGAMVAFQLQIPIEQAKGMAQAAVTQQTTPGASPSPQPHPHIPAAPGAIGGAPQGQSGNPWADIAREFEEFS